MFTAEARKRMKQFTTITPTTLPPTMVQLGELFGASLSLDGARRVSHIEISKIPSGYWVDIWMLKPDGHTHILRSVRTDLTCKQARDLHREVTRKIAVFLFENKDVQLNQPNTVTAFDPANDVRTTKDARTNSYLKRPLGIKRW